MIILPHTNGIPSGTPPEIFVHKVIDNTNITYYETEQEFSDYLASLPPTPINPVEQIAQDFIKKIEDGKSYFIRKVSELFYEVQVGNMPLEDALYIEEKLEKVKSELSEGQWVTARDKMDKVSPNGVLTQEIYDNIRGGIHDYILANYPVIFH